MLQLIFLFLSSLGLAATDQSLMSDERSSEVSITQPTAINIKKPVLDKNEFVLAPVPFLNPSQGWGLALVGQYIFTLDDDSSPPSVVAGGAFYTEKHSYGGALGYLGKIHNDQWRIGLVTGKATMFYNFYGIGYNQNKADISIPLKQEVSFVGLRLMKQLGRRIFLGIEFIGAEIKSAIDSDDDPLGVADEISMENNFVAPHLKLERDTQDDSFYPTDGSLFSVEAEFHSEKFHDQSTYQAYKSAWNHYIGVADFDVLAYRVMTRWSFGEVPFYSLSMFGQMGDLRGYETGKYRDKNMWAGQIEWRHRFTDRWGTVVFGGVGQLAPSLQEFSGAPWLSSGGLGLRMRIAKKNPLDFRFDTAYGDQKISYYFSVGQAF
jgi:Outer membrane protein